VDPANPWQAEAEMAAHKIPANGVIVPLKRNSFASEQATGSTNYIYWCASFGMGTHPVLTIDTRSPVLPYLIALNGRKNAHVCAARCALGRIAITTNRCTIGIRKEEQREHLARRRYRQQNHQQDEPVPVVARTDIRTIMLELKPMVGQLRLNG
jgi:hypothetical protein